jgi:hypothetical protein
MLDRIAPMPLTCAVTGSNTSTWRFPMKRIISIGLLTFIATSCTQPLPVVVAPALPPGQLGETATLTGKADKWIGAAKTIKLEVLNPINRKYEYLQTGTIDAAGIFSILLPGKTIMAPYLENNKEVYLKRPPAKVAESAKL